MDESIWQLPGPGRMLDQVAREVSRGRHVGMVLPAVQTAEPRVVEGLLATLMRRLSATGEDPLRGYLGSTDEDPLRSLSRCLVYAEEQPVVVADFLDHEEAAGRTAVLCCTDASAEQNARLSEVLTRIVVQSRPRPAHRRPRVVVVGSRHLLPRLPGGTDVTFEAVWWWGRLTRWDVAARIAPILEGKPNHAILREVELETLVEVCRWDTDLAEELAASWNSDPFCLATAIREHGKAYEQESLAIHRFGHSSPAWPDGGLLESWDEGHVELWQHECRPGPYGLLASPDGIEQAVWVAQARVLLPWIEARRQALQRRLIGRYGDAAFRRAATRKLGEMRTPIEVGPLYHVAQDLVPRSDAVSLDAARQLMAARNRLAHLKILTLGEQLRLIETCTGLGE